MGLVKAKLKSYAKDEETAAKTSAKMDSFAAGFGTVLFLKILRLIKSLQGQFTSYAESFPVWAEHSTAIAQFATWTALHAEGLGASLQHYNPIVDEQVHAEWDIPQHWKMRYSWCLVRWKAKPMTKPIWMMQYALKFLNNSRH